MENSGSSVKKIYLNGKLVGEVETTGDYDKDAEIATQFLKEKGLYKERSTADFAFHQALSFATVASLIYERELTKVPTRAGARLHLL